MWMVFGGKQKNNYQAKYFEKWALGSQESSFTNEKNVENSAEDNPVVQDFGKRGGKTVS